MDEDFDNNFGVWLEANGVTLGPWREGAGVQGFVDCTVNLNVLKIAILRLMQHKHHVHEVYLRLVDASQGTVDPDRAMAIAKRAVELACDNEERK